MCHSNGAVLDYPHTINHTQNTIFTCAYAKLSISVKLVRLQSHHKTHPNTYMYTVKYE